MKTQLTELADKWQALQLQYEAWANDPEMSAHNRAKFTYKAMATRDCRKELLKIIHEKEGE